MILRPQIQAHRLCAPVQERIFGESRPQGVFLHRNRDFAIESLRWLAILAVVMHHGISRQRQSPATVEQILLLKEWIEWCVPAFFYVSGRLFRPSSAGEFFQHLAGRARRLLIPYALVSGLSFSALWVLHNSGLWRHSQPQELEIGSFVHALVWLVGFGPQLYFLPYLFVVGLLAGIVAMILPKRWLSAFALVLFLVCGFGWMMPSTVLGPSLQRIPAFLFSFCLGISDRAWNDKGARVHLATSLFAMAATCLAAGDWWPLSVAAPLVLYRLLARLPTAPIIRRLDRIGSPGGIFLWHAPLVLPASSSLLGALGIVDWGNYLLSVIIACIASLMVSKLIARIPILRAANL